MSSRTRMLPRFGALLAGLTLVGLVAAPTLANVGEAQTLTIHDIEVKDHPDVTVTVEPPAVLSGDQLPDEAFAISEDGTTRDVQVAAGPATDLEVVLTLDTSGSVKGEPMTALRQGAIEFVEQMPAEARIGLVQFADAPEIVHTPTTDHDAVIDGIRELEPSNGTALYDAVSATLDLFRDSEATQAAVLFADGQDSASDSTLADAVAVVKDAEVPLHVIELTTDAHRPEALQQLADASDGQLIATADTDELSALYEQVASTLVRQYKLTYSSDATGKTEVAVTVDHDGTHVTGSQTAAFPEPPAPEGAVLTPSLWSGGVWLLVGAALVYCALAAGILLTLAPRRRAVQLAGASHQRVHGGRTALAGLADRAVHAADDTLERQGKRRAINQDLERAGIAMRAGELVVVTVGCGFAALVVGMVLLNVWIGLVLAILSPLVVRMVIARKVRRRQQAFLDQLSDTLQMLSGGLRAGYGLQQAFDAVAKEASSPTAEELNRVLVEVRLGRDLMDSLDAMADRMASEDFSWVVQAIAIHREVGGDLAEVLDTVAGTVRERARVRRQVKALSAEGRMSAWVLFALPFVVGGAIMLLNPEYLAILKSSIVGLAMLVGAAGMLVVGGLWLRRVVNLEY